MTGINRHPGVEMMNEEQDYVFHYEPDHQESSHQNASAPIHKGRYGLNLNRKGNTVMFDSGPSLLGPGPTKQTHLKKFHSHNTPGRVGAAISSGANPRNTTPTRMRGSVMGGTGSILLEPGPHRLIFLVQRKFPPEELQMWISVFL